MKNKYLFLFVLFFTLYSWSAQSKKVQEDSIIVDRSVYKDYFPLPAPSQQELQRYRSYLKQSRSIAERPRRVNNAEDGHFSPIFNQDLGSCGCASAVAYQFAHELNSYRNTNGSLPENMLPTHFPWLIASHHSTVDELSAAVGIPNIVDYGGRTFSRLFGNTSQDTDDKFGWMQGYDKWHRAMFNRLKYVSSIGSLDNEETREFLKQWLWNHLGDTSYSSGGIAGFGVAAGGDMGIIPAGSYEAGKYYVATWGPTYNHALTIVGYDDDIEIDLNANGSVEEDEKGAWIIANSWGNGWANNGFIYCPYKNARVSYNPTTKTWDNSWISVGIEHIRKDYAPKRTIKISMNYTVRNQLLLQAGIAADTTATKPDLTIDMHHFRFAGNACPMLGQWKDGMHYESMEFGYDLTDLSKSFDQTKPLKYFFIINTQSGSTGVGKIDSCSIINYELDDLGTSIPFDNRNVEIKNNGAQTIISVVVPGIPINAPNNLTLTEISENEISLAWTKPERTAFTLTGYRIYSDGTILADNIPASTLNFTDSNAPAGSNYQVSALYAGNKTNIESLLTEKVCRKVEVIGNHGAKFTQGGFSIPNVFDQPLSQFTIEFWAKPSAVRSWNWHIGPGWDTFLMHFSSDNAKNIVVGYSTTDRISGGTLKVNQWNHIAITVNGPTIFLYLNGAYCASGKFPNHNGINGINSFDVGRGGIDGIQGEIDEFRVWNTVRTQKQIRANKDLEIANPERESNLIGYYKMDVINGKLLDCKENNNATYIGTAPVMTTQTALSSNVTDSNITADFEVDSTVLYVDKVIKLTNKSGSGSTNFLWNAPEGGLVNSHQINPKLVYTSPGTYNITLISSNNSSADTLTQQIKIGALPAPKANFIPSYTAVSSGQRISFVNLSSGDFCEYHWYFDGGTPSEVSGYNAATTYNTTGKYTVRLVATNPAGKDSIIKEDIIDVIHIIPTAEFNADQMNIKVGDTVHFTDKSIKEPTIWKWIIENESIQTITDQNPAVAFTKPGNYTVTLIAGNSAGCDTIVKQNFISVVEPDAGEALCFDGMNDYVQIDNIFNTEPLKAFTIEWWMCPSANEEAGQQMGDQSGTILFQTSVDGKLKVLFNSSNLMLSSSIMIPGEWAHFAFVFDNGKGTIYKNGMKITAKTFTLKEVPAWVNGFKIGCDGEKTIDGIIDEFRIWNIARTQDELIETISAPLKNISTATGLEVYYRFDQNSGNVVDALGNHTAKRINFGPDGDAWTKSGAFNLCTDANLIQAIVPDYDQTSVNINFVVGLGLQRAVFIKKAIEENGSPVDETIYSASTNWTIPGSKLENSGYYCVGNGTSNSYSVTGLEPNTEYEVMIVEYLYKNRLPVYFKTSSHAKFTTGVETNELAVRDLLSSISQTYSSIEIRLKNARKHSLRLLNLLGETVYEAMEESDNYSIPKSALSDKFYILEIDHSESHKIVVTQ